MRVAQSKGSAASEPMPAWLRRSSRVLLEERGAVSVEFAVIIPGVLLLLSLFVSASFLLATDSDVQQLAHELARGSLAVFDTTQPIEEGCNELRAQLLPELVHGLPLLEAQRVVSVRCDFNEATSFLTVGIEYDLRGTFGSVAGRLVGLDLDSVARHSFFRL